METKFCVLNGKIAESNLLRRDIAKRLGISNRSFRNKMTGETSFTWDEVKLIRNEFFPGIPLEQLFKTRDD